MTFKSEGGTAVTAHQPPGTAGSSLMPGASPASPGASPASPGPPAPPLTIGDIDLSDTAFWGWPTADRQAAFALLRAREQPAFFAEPETPFAEHGPGLLRVGPARGRGRGEPEPRLFCSGAGRDEHRRPARRVQRVLRLDDQHGRPPARPAAPDRVPGVHPEDDQEVRGGRAAGGRRGSSTTCWRPGPCDFVEHVAARLPLKIICDMMGIARRALRHGAAEHQHHPVRRRPRVPQRGPRTRRSARS